MRTLLLAVTAASLLAGCGGKEPEKAEATPTPTPGEELRLLPMVIGATWTYRVHDVETGVMEDKTRTIEAYEDIGGRKAGMMGFRMRVETVNGYSLSWHEDLGPEAGVVRHRKQEYDLNGVLEKEEYYEENKLRADELPAHRIAGATWVENYSQTKIKPGMPEETTPEVRNWYVIAESESITVPAGTFEALRVHRTSPAGETDKTYWFVEGIGPVKEIDTGGDEDGELVSYTIPDA